METMRYTEHKKGSKLVTIGLILFILVGGILIYFAMQAETTPDIIGEDKSDINKLLDIDTSNYETEKNKNSNIKYEIKNKTIEDKTNKKISGNIVLPEIYVEGVVLKDVNDKIAKDYSDIFSGLKTQMLDAENTFEYIVSYDYYDNMVGSKKIVSFVIRQKILDKSNENVTMERINTYNVDLAGKKEISQSDIAKNILGVDYKTILRKQIIEYLVENQIMSEEEFNYTITGLENFYIKEGNLYIIFNSDELENNDHGILEINIKSEGGN